MLRGKGSSHGPARVALPPLQPWGPEPGTPSVGGRLSSVSAALGGASDFVGRPPGVHWAPAPPCVFSLSLSPSSSSFSDSSSFKSSQSCPSFGEMIIYLVMR